MSRFKKNLLELSGDRSRYKACPKIPKDPPDSLAKRCAPCSRGPAFVLSRDRSPVWTAHQPPSVTSLTIRRAPYGSQSSKWAQGSLFTCVEIWRSPHIQGSGCPPLETRESSAHKGPNDHWPEKRASRSNLLRMTFAVSPRPPSSACLALLVGTCKQAPPERTRRFRAALRRVTRPQSDLAPVYVSANARAFFPAATPASPTTPRGEMSMMS